jgi:hypothetical protein
MRYIFLPVSLPKDLFLERFSYSLHFRFVHRHFCEGQNFLYLALADLIGKLKWRLEHGGLSMAGRA